MDIGEVIKKSGLPASTIRFYEEKGLIKSIGRKGLRRIFKTNILEELALITLGRNAGFTLKEISSLFTTSKAQIDREKLIIKANELDIKIKELTAMRDGLKHAASCPENSHLECQKFQRLLNITVRKQRKKSMNL